MSLRVHALIKCSQVSTYKKNGKLCHTRNYLTWVFWGAIGINVLTFILASGEQSKCSSSRMEFPHVRLDTRCAVLEKQVSPEDSPHLPATPPHAHLAESVTGAPSAICPHGQECVSPKRFIECLSLPRPEGTHYSKRKLWKALTEGNMT